MEQSAFHIEDLRLIAALAGSGSLAGAARSLGVNHTSAWRRLNLLEERLGVRLFARGRTGYAATAAGEEAIGVAIRVLEHLTDLDRRLAGRDIKLTGTVRLTTTDTLVGLLTPTIVQLRATHPGIVVEIVTSNVFFTLTRRDADIALRPTAAAPEGLVARRLAEVRTALYCTGAYADRRSGEALAALDWLSPDETLAHLGATRWIAANVPPERVIFRASSFLALQEAAHAGLGVTPLPCYMGDPNSALVRLSPPIEEMSSSLWLLTHSDLRQSPRVRVVLDQLALQFAARRKLIEAAEPPPSNTLRQVPVRHRGARSPANRP